jgi:hypothetical protein
MASWITTKRLLLRQDAKSLHTRNQENDATGSPTGNMDIPWAQQCIITSVKMSTSQPQLASASWTYLIFFPHNYKMPQLSSTDRLIMAAKYMMNALQNPHLEVPFTHVGDDTISALTELAEILKLKLRGNQPPTISAAPPKVNLRTCLAESPNPI